MKKRQWTNLLLLVFIVTFCVVSCSRPVPADPAEDESLPLNIIIFIGDGMGVSHITAAKTIRGTLHMERLRHCALVTTHPDSGFVTDSAASGTALSTGEKTLNGMVSVSPDGRKYKTLFEYASGMKKSTGLVVTSSVTHATPAVFVSHVKDRGDNCSIAEQIADSDIDILFGGGAAWFMPESVEGSMRRDEKDLIARLRERLDIALTPEEFRKLGDTRGAAALLTMGHSGTVSQREISLTQMTEKAIRILSRDPDGFILMVEGSQIDWEGHDNNLGGIISETIDFDDAVGAGVDFAADNGRTLVVVTADHETGGLALNDGSIDEKKITEASFSTDDHTGTMVALFATGPGSELFGGIIDNTSIGKILIGLTRKGECGETRARNKKG
ncbi:MAG: alkaline phosphatase [Candidatus Krumholzibacteriota bacterium]|nr:alkaline phosphatase [Candidatus Krumholzibacteriota bacterium]